MDFTQETAFSAAQIIAVLLVATILDPWAKEALTPGEESAGGKRRVGAWVAYVAKILALCVLLLDMQVVLFDNPWSGTAAVALAIANYAAIVALALSVLLAVLTHLGAIGRPSTKSE